MKIDLIDLTLMIWVPLCFSLLAAVRGVKDEYVLRYLFVTCLTTLLMITLWRVVRSLFRSAAKVWSSGAKTNTLNTL